MRVRYAAAHILPVSVPRFAALEHGTPLAAAAMELGGRVTDRLPGVELPLFDIDARVYGGQMYAFAWPAGL
jgi:hypothetical protein